MYEMLYDVWEIILCIRWYNKYEMIMMWDMMFEI